MKAIIEIDGKQKLVQKGDKLAINGRLEKKTLEFKAFALVDGDKTKVGNPEVAGTSVKAKVIDDKARSDKVTSIRYKSKKRVHKIRGNRQDQTIIEVTSIN